VQVQRRGVAVLQRLPATQSPSLAQTKRHTPVAGLQLDAPHRACALNAHDG